MESVLAESTQRYLADMVGTPMVCLDYGGGTGTLGDTFAGGRMFGLDIERPCDIQGCGMSLPFKDATFDCVLASASLHHLPDVDRGISEISRITKPGGSLVIFEVNALHPHRWLAGKLYKPKQWCDDDRPIKPKHLTVLLNECGYTVTSEYMTPVYRNPSLAARIQDVVAKLFKIHSYIICRGVKCTA